MVVTGIINKIMITPDSMLIDVDEKTFHKNFGYSVHQPDTILFWSQSDSEELFDENVSKKSTRKQLISGGWTKDSIMYRYNNYGFRSDDNYNIKSPLPGNMFLGDSFTDGIGLNIEDTWGYKLNKKLGGVFYNLGQGGSGLETQYRLFKAWAPIIKPKKVFTLGALEPRREFITNPRRKYPIGAWDLENQQFFQKFLSNDLEVLISYHRTLDAIKRVAQELNIEFYALSAQVQFEAMNIEKLNYRARDLMHFGPAYHDYLVNNFDRWIRLV